MPTSSQRSALKAGYITQKQYDKLPSKMLDGVIRHNKSKGKKPKGCKGNGKKPKCTC